MMKLTVSERERFLDLYHNFVSEHDDSFLFEFLHEMYDLLCWKSELFEKLNIELSMDEIEDIYRKTGVIVLRRPSAADGILVACGNSPIASNYAETEDNKHTHLRFITIDPDIMMNPTIIAFFLKQNSGLARAFSIFMPNTKFNLLAFEAASPIAKTYEEIKHYDFSFFEPNFKTVEVDRFDEINTSSLEEQTVEDWDKNIRAR